jgi:hypothetical protein
MAFRIMFTEPIVISLAATNAFGYALLFLFLEGQSQLLVKAHFQTRKQELTVSLRSTMACQVSALA